MKRDKVVVMDASGKVKLWDYEIVAKQLQHNIKNAKDLWELHRALAAFEHILDEDDDTENELKYLGIDICELPTFGGNAPESTSGVWSWDEDHLLVGEGPFVEWRIVERNEEKNP